MLFTVIGIGIVALLGIHILIQCWFIKSIVNTTEQLGKIYSLVNTNMDIHLSVAAAALRRVAEISHDPVDIRIASKAEQKLSSYVINESRKSWEMDTDKGAV